MEEKKYEGKPRGGGGLGQGRPPKPHKAKSFRFSEKVAAILEKFTDPSKIVTEMVEVAILELNQQFEQKVGFVISQDESQLLSDKKNSIFKKMKKVQKIPIN